jgi:hypothetical protein
MNTEPTLVFVLGLLIRVALPLAITALIAYALHRLDIRWQAEAKREQQQLVHHEIPCLKEQGISAEQMKLRAMMSGDPCWQMYRQPNGYLRETCLDCEVFRSAPIPHIRSHIHTIKL